VENNSNVLVPAVERAFDILEFLAEQNNPVSLKEISAKMKIPTVSCFRIVKYICSRGYINEEQNGLYSLGLRNLLLSEKLLKKMDIVNLSQNAMQELAAETNQAVQLALPHQYGVIYINQIMPLHPINVIAPIGSIIPINVSASGKILTAFLSDLQRNKCTAAATFVNKTKNSITDKALFEIELLKVKELGYAEDNEEYAIGVGCLAAPIFNHTKECVAAIGITGNITDYHNSKKYESYVKLIGKASQKVSKLMGYNL